MLEPLFDDYDRMNNKAAKHFLIYLLSKELGALIKKMTQDDDTFAIVWMLILQSIQSASIEVFEEIKNHIKARHPPSQYSGENLAKLGKYFIDNATHLESAGQYDPKLMLHMVKIFLQAGGEGKLAEDFCHKICTLKKSMSDELLKIRFMTKDDADNYVVQKLLTFQAICEAVEIQYCTFKDQNEWLLAKNVWDSKAPPTQYGANIVEEKACTCTEFMTLM
jgi:hypothetical protein